MTAPPAAGGPTIDLHDPPAYVACDWSDGSTTTTTREVVLRYVATYPPPFPAWRAATEAEIADRIAERERLGMGRGTTSAKPAGPTK